MSDKVFEYRIVCGHIHTESKKIEAQLNELAREGFRVTDVAHAGGGYQSWTLEREILPAHPYRG